MKRMKREQAGFTLIELVMVIVILGILGAMAIPKFVDLSGSAKTASVESMEGAVKSAWAVTIAEKKRAVTVAEIAANVDGGTAANDGIDVDVDGTTYTVLTWTAANCTGATAGTGDTVLCVNGTDPVP